MNDIRIGRDELERFVPHSGSMLLLDGLVSWTEGFDRLTSRALITPENPFYDSAVGGVPSIVGFEYMAQTIAALSGLERHLRGDSDPRIGYIIGTRKFTSDHDLLPVGLPLEIEVNELFRDGPVVSFDCTIRCDGSHFATGTINAFEPERSEA